MSSSVLLSTGVTCSFLGTKFPGRTSLGCEFGGLETKASPLELSPPHGLDGAFVELFLEGCLTNDGDGGVEGERRSFKIDTPAG